ncbi:hypothetical protein BU15DRAFT_37603, partial [Melanogaster broomeanus]
LKHEPPFTYKGEIQAGLFKKWVREVREWIVRGRLTPNQGIKLSGKYLAQSAYNFYERDILDLKKRYTLTEYFESMFDYLFPPDFRMQQRDKFDVCTQEKKSVRDFLRKLKNLADTVGNIDDRDIVLAFW